MEAGLIASSVGAARRSIASAHPIVEAAAARLSGTVAAGSYGSALSRPNQSEGHSESLSRVTCSKTKRSVLVTRVQALLAADHEEALPLGNILSIAAGHAHLQGPTSVVSGSACIEQQQLDFTALHHQTACMAAASAGWVQAQGMRNLAGDKQEMVSSMQMSGTFNVGGGAADNTGALMAFELLSTTAASPGACTPSAEVNALAAAVSASLVAHQDPQQQPIADTVITAVAAQAEQERQQMDRVINACMIGAAAIYATTKVLTVDHDYWHGWTVYEILRNAPMHNWRAYEEALKRNPVLAKMMISGIVYALGDWIAQCCEGKPVLDFKRERMIRSGLVGFCLHGSLSHYYYYVCEALFPFKQWWVVPLKVAFDQTIWSAFWNSVYFVVLGLLRLESPFTIASELKSTFWPLLTAGWKLWPFAHLITYGFVPVEQRLLWVDMVELVWVTILSMYSNEKAEARQLVNEAASELNVTSNETEVYTR
ncbi:hypothetical protein L7F22_014243 [Adiantum nelumboides]|nr:hypothetical protein [Adiantum nelumboides]